MFPIRYIVILISVVAFFTGCSSDEPSAASDFQFNMVTYTGMADGAIFSYQAYDDSPEIILRAADVKNVDMRIGQRTMMNYVVTGEATRNIRDISIRGVSHVLFDSLRMSSIDNINGYPNNPMQLKSIWRTGNFININCLLQYTGRPRQFAMIMDKDTWHEEIVDVYVIDNVMGAETYFYRKAYASFFVGNVWYLPTCRTLRVHLNVENYPEQYYDFSK